MKRSPGCVLRLAECGALTSRTRNSALRKAFSVWVKVNPQLREGLTRAKRLAVRGLVVSELSGSGDT